MALLLHLAFAFGSMAYATYAIFRPSKSKLHTTYALVGFTFVSGFALVFTKPAHMAEVCVTGLLYVGYVSFALISARNRLAGAGIRQERGRVK